MRRDMVTRTLLGTKATVKVVDPATEQISKTEVLVNKAFHSTDDPKLMKAIKKVLADNLIVIKIESVEECNKLYGMDTSKFMELAMELDPETRKVLATGEETEETETDEE